MKDLKLTIELVPSSSWYDNVRSKVSPAEWDIIRKKCYRMANYRCEICGGVGPTHPVECHELWEYDDINHTQTLIKLVSLCPSCHQVKHIGLSTKLGKLDDCIGHLRAINGSTATEVKKYINQAMRVWEERSCYDWEVDISYLQKYLTCS